MRRTGFDAASVAVALFPSLGLRLVLVDAGGDQLIQFGTPKAPRPAELERWDLAARCEPVDRALARLKVGRNLIQGQDVAIRLCHCRSYADVEF